MVDITTNLHISAFPSKMIAGLGGAHQFNVRLSSRMDNGQLCGRSAAWVDFDEYSQAPVPESNPFEGRIMGKTKKGDRWYVEATADCDALWIYNSPISEYPEKRLQDERLFVNEIGDTARCYEIKKGDMFELSDEAFQGTPAENKTLTYASGKYVVGA